MERLDSPSSAKVRDLIFAYERQSSSIEHVEDLHRRPRAKSIGNALSYKLFRQANLEFHNILDIEKELVKIEAHLNYYEVYEKETHVAFQEQLFNVLTSIVSIDPEDQEGSIEIKRKLILETQKLATILNSKLPFDGKNSYKGVRKTYSSLVRKEEAVVSTTSVKTEEHRAVLSSHNSTLNERYKSEESLTSTKDSVDLSLKADDSSSVDLKYLEERSQSISPPPQKNIVDEEHHGYIPSVSKLKQFFSFRRETKPELRVTSASYSGLSRTQSLNLKTNKYTVIKRNKNEETKKKEKAISESDEGTEKRLSNDFTTTTIGKELNSTMSIDQSIQPDSSETSLYIEPTKEIKEYREVENETTHNVSVSKLKSLFEEKRNENNEGLALLTKQKQNEFYSDFNLPYNAMNLGAYRLKRTISGNYMNFTGLLRNVDVQKKTDLSKSKSLSDLKSSGFEAKEINYDLSKEIDDDDDFEHVSNNLGKDSEINNNLVINEDKITIENNSTSKETNQEKSDIVVSRKVEILKKSFEHSNISETTSIENNDDIKHILHRTIQPIPSTNGVSAEPLLKVPIQLRTGFTNISHSEESIEKTFENNISTENIVTDNNGVSEEPILKVPIQLRVGASNLNVTATENSEKEVSVSGSVQRENETIVLSNTVENLKQTFENLSASTKPPSEDNYTEIKHTLHKTIEPLPSTTDKKPVLKVPIQLKTGFSNITQPENVIENVHNSASETIKDIKEVINKTTESNLATAKVQEEPELKVPVQLKIGVTNISKLSKVSENVYDSAIETEKDIKEVVNKTIESNLATAKVQEEPELKVPIQLRIGVTNISKLSEVSENVHDSAGKTEKDIKEVVNKTKESNLATAKVQEEPELKVPVQLRIGVTNISTLSEIPENNHDSTSETKNDKKDVVHRTIEPTLSTVKGTKKPVLEKPIQLKLGVANISTSPELAEQLNQLTAETVSKEEYKVDSTQEQEPFLKVPVQLRVGISNSATENIIATEETKVTTDSGKQERIPIAEVTLYSNDQEKKLGFTGETKEDIKDVVHKTTEPNLGATEVLEEPELKVPVQFRIGVTNISTVSEVSEVSGSGQNIDDTQPNHHDTTEEISSTTNNSETQLLKVPVQLRPGLATTVQSQHGAEQLNQLTTKTISKEEVTEDNTQAHNSLLKVPIELRVDNSSDTDNIVSRQNGTMARARIEEKTQSFMKILESPTAFSTLISSSSSSQGQHIGSSSTSKVSVSYSQKKTVQLTSSTHVSQRIVTSSSSSFSTQQLGQNLLEVPQEPILYSSLSNPNNSTEENTVTIEEVGDNEGVLDNSTDNVLVTLAEEEDDKVEKSKSKINLNVSQENIIEEILKETDLLENVEEEFEKMLEENNK